MFAFGDIVFWRVIVVLWVIGHKCAAAACIGVLAMRCTCACVIIFGTCVCICGATCICACL